VQFFLESWYLFAIAVVSGSLLAWPVLRGGLPSGGVSCIDAVQLINRDKAVVIDVRDAAEFATGHVVNAKNCAYASLAANTAGLPKNKALPLVVVCNTGALASRSVAALRKLGYTHPYTLTGGLRAWREANFPLEKLTEKPA
jgi:rhodanese-related sulfurtransferase